MNFKTKHMNVIVPYMKIIFNPNLAQCDTYITKQLYFSQCFYFPYFCVIKNFLIGVYDIFHVLATMISLLQYLIDTCYFVI